MEQTEQKHTPTPWAIKRTEDWATLSVSIVDSDGQEVATITPRGSTPDEMEANAAFIVTACNSHDALVEALEMLLADLNSMPQCYIQEDHENFARAALTLATGAK